MANMDYPLIRASLAPEYSSLSPAQIQDIIRTLYGGETLAEDVEGWLQDVGRGFRKAARSVGKALPGIAAGAGTGAAFGPWGALVGGLAGGVGSILKQSRNKTARAIGGGISSVGNLVSTVRGGGASGGLGALGSIATGVLGRGAPGGAAAALLGGGQRPGGGAANALLGMITRPETLQAMGAGAMGTFGRRQLPIGGQQVPVHQYLSSLGTLAQRAGQEAAELDPEAEQLSPQFEVATEALGLDAEDAEARTDTLLTLLALTPSIWASQNRPVNVTVAPAPPPAPEPPPVTVAEQWPLLWQESFDEDEGDEWDEDTDQEDEREGDWGESVWNEWETVRG